MKKRIGFGLLIMWILISLACGQAAAPQGTPVIEVNATMDAAATVAVTVPANNETSIEGVVVFDTPSRDHVQDFRYPESDLPPAGGVHHPIWLNCGVYTEPVPVELTVHSLEHGSVWISYEPELDETSVATLQQLAKGQTHIVVAPYPGLKSPVVLTAWARQLELESATDPRIAEFIAAYLNGAQSPEPNVTCAEGVGNPVTIP